MSRDASLISIPLTRTRTNTLLASLKERDERNSGEFAAVARGEGVEGGFSPLLQVASRSKNPEVITAWINAIQSNMPPEEAMEIFAQKGPRGQTFLHFLVEDENPAVGAILNTLRPEFRQNVMNQQDENGKTALYYAVEERNPGLVSTLLNRGANWLIADNSGVLPAQILESTITRHISSDIKQIRKMLDERNERYIAGSDLATQTAAAPTYDDFVGIDENAAARLPVTRGRVATRRNDYRGDDDFADSRNNYYDYDHESDYDSLESPTRRPTININTGGASQSMQQGGYSSMQAPMPAASQPSLPEPPMQPILDKPSFMKNLTGKSGPEAAQGLFKTMVMVALGLMAICHYCL
jgi:hypothetical protein